MALFAAVVTVGATPAAATNVGPCEFRLDTPHRSSQVYYTENVNVIRSHSKYYCTSQVLYVNAQATLYYCGNGSSPSACAPVAEDAATDAATNVNYDRTRYKPLTTTDSDPSPASGWYVAKAVYEVCVFNGGVFPGEQQSAYAHWDNDQGKVDIVLREVPNIDLPPL